MATPEIKAQTVTRQQLYDQVWTTAMRRLASDYGLSDVGLAKICKKHDIPRPPLGYWAKKEFGKAPPRPPLPPNDDAELQDIHLCACHATKAGETSPQPEPAFDSDILDLLDRAKALPRVVVGKTLRGLHPLVQQTKEWFDERDWNDEDLVRGRQCGFSWPLQLRVSRACLPRAYRFLDALIKTIEGLGGKLFLGGLKWRPETIVHFADEKVTNIRLRERYRVTRLVPDKKDQFSWPRRKLTPLGLLILDSGCPFVETCHCRDTEKGQKIEDRINQLVIGWIHAVGMTRIEDRCRQEEYKLREEQERIRQQREAELARQLHELEERQKAERQRVDGLFREAAAWREAQMLRDYIQAVESLLLQRDGIIEEGGKAADWLRWARQQADRQDPLTPNPASILDQRPDSLAGPANS